MIGLRTSLLSILSICFLLTGCVLYNGKEEKGESFVRLKLDIEVSNLPSSPKTKGYEDPESDNERMNTLRIIVVRESGIVEHNTYLNFTKPDLSIKNKEYKVVGGEKKKIFLIANEGNEKVTYNFSNLKPGTEFPESEVNAALITMTENNDEITGIIPMTACHVVDMPLKDYKTELFIIRAATKFTYIITNNTSNPLSFSKLKISKGASKEYLFPRITSSSSWGDYTDGGTTVTVPGGMLIENYEVPMVGNNEYYEFQKDYSISVAAGSEVKIAPFFLLEGKYTDGNSGGKNYSTTLTINGLDYFEYLPDLSQLPRNTHAVVRATFSKNNIDLTVSVTVEVLPYGEVILEPGFGQ